MHKPGFQYRYSARIARLMDGADGALTVSAYFDEIDRLQESTLEDEEKQLVLEALYEWGERAGEACAF